MKKYLTLFAVAVALLGMAALAHKPIANEPMKVVYHVSDAEKVAFTLGNIRNHIKGVGGPENVDIVLVAHGPALKAFHGMEASEKVSEMVTGLQSQGVTFEACGNTMRAQSVSLDDLLPDFFRRDEGGVVRIADLQSQGYIYLRP